MPVATLKKNAWAFIGGKVVVGAWLFYRAGACKKHIKYGWWVGSNTTNGVVAYVTTVVVHYHCGAQWNHITTQQGRDTVVFILLLLLF